MMMKHLKLSVLSLLSAAAFTFTSCLDDGDDTLYYGGMGSVEFGSTLLLDNGVKVKLSGTTLSDDSHRMFVTGAVVPEEGMDYNNIRPGQTVTLTNVSGLGLLSGGALLNGMADFEDYNLKEMNNVGYFEYAMIGNGYVQLQFETKVILHDKKDENNKVNGREVIEPKTCMFAEVNDEGNVDLYIGCDNRREEFVDASAGDDSLREGYYDNGDTRLFPYSFNIADVYRQLQGQGIGDEESISVNVYKVTKKDDGTLATQKVSLSALSNVKVTYLKPSYR